jgi:predicted polyphosphate/ATP-dependent NAD kinase
LVQASKSVLHQTSQEGALEEIGDYFKEIVQEKNDTLFFLGAGSTVGRVKRWLDMEATLLGIDAYYRGEQVGTDLNEEDILGLIESTDAGEYAICISPIGAQGFILGRGSQQFSPQVLRKVGIHNIFVVATPDKLDSIGALRVDTGDARLDREMSGFRRVILGFRMQRMVRLV